MMIFLLEFPFFFVYCSAFFLLRPMCGLHFVLFSLFLVFFVRGRGDLIFLNLSSVCVRVYEWIIWIKIYSAIKARKCFTDFEGNTCLYDCSLLHNSYSGQRCDLFVFFMFQYCCWCLIPKPHVPCPMLDAISLNWLFACTRLESLFGHKNSICQSSDLKCFRWRHISGRSRISNRNCCRTTREAATFSHLTRIM